MAKRNYLVEGLSGVGKSSVYDELIRRGYKAISTDRVWSHHADPETGLVEHPGGPIRYDTWTWDSQKAISALESPEPEVVFFCGSCRNRDHLLAYLPRSSPSASTMRPCVAASKSVPLMTGHSRPRQSSSCSS